MKNTTSTTRRVAVSAAAAVVAMAMAAPTAGAAAGAPDIFAGTSEALALDLRVKAPAEVLGALASLTGGLVSETGEIVQQISITNAALSSEGIANVKADLLDGLVDYGSLSNTDGQTEGSQSIAALDGGVVSFGAGTTSYVADTVNNVTHSASELAYVKVSLQSLFSDSSPVPAAVQDAVQDAVAQVTDTVNGLVGELNGVLGEVEQTVEDVTSTIIDIPSVLPEQLPTVPDVTKVNLVEIRKIWAVSDVFANTGLVRAESSNGILEASLLGGLIQVPAFQYTTWSETAGTPGSADAGGEVTTIAIKVGETEVAVKGDVLSVGDFVLDLSDPNLAGLPAGELLAPVTDLLKEILNTVGISVAQGELVTNVAADGSSASAAASAFALNIAPLNAIGAADTLAISLNLLPTRTAVSAAPAPVTVAPPAPAAPSMPRTGGGALAMVIGAMTMGGAGLLRRRF